MAEVPGFPDEADDDYDYDYDQGAKQDYESTPVMSESVRYATPEIALGHDLGQASAHGSPKARRMAKVMAWVIIVSMVLPLLALLFFG